MNVLRMCMAALAACLAVGARSASAENLKHFFDANNAQFQAYVDKDDHTQDARGRPLATVKLMAFSPAFRDWIEKNFPHGHDAAYALDPYSIDCSSRQVAEHRLVYYDNNGLPLASYDFGDTMGTPIPHSMKDYLVQEICGH